MVGVAIELCVGFSAVVFGLVNVLSDVHHSASGCRNLTERARHNSVDCVSSNVLDFYVSTFDKMIVKVSVVVQALAGSLVGR